ncbi:hypothetical protein TIFTF001_054596 [Ficus carica]|uniref:Uncharacterized protein n=1 Tax=Ficus carica TaxID=3494 RepID=A0AA88JEV2_FICCA|nr:hypothetical protein TIFTF001_054526 [Ficus carica]GMN70758.1 hypothetical protein TIFTF001_054527 [Ficus carica]GMN71280.1 hypothetical protein TIFTF001_054595 [Ficus carica]GMN71285.1 hypothetical protein TIFTF001_054596 [Ficus carica]
MDAMLQDDIGSEWKE